MNCVVTGTFFCLGYRTTKNGNSYHELRILQRNEKGVNTEVFNIFDDKIVDCLKNYKEGEIVSLDVDVYIKNSFLQKRVNRIIDIQTGEVIV